MSTIIESKEFWEEQLEKFKTSGLPRSKYCLDHGINYDRFGYWIRRLKVASTTFVPVKIQAAGSAPHQNHTTLCTLELRGNILKIHDLSVLSFLLERLA